MGLSRIWVVPDVSMEETRWVGVPVFLVDALSTKNYGRQGRAGVTSCKKGGRSCSPYASGSII